MIMYFRYIFRTQLEKFLTKDLKPLLAPRNKLLTSSYPKKKLQPIKEKEHLVAKMADRKLLKYIPKNGDWKCLMKLPDFQDAGTAVCEHNSNIYLVGAAEMSFARNAAKCNPFSRTTHFFPNLPVPLKNPGLMVTGNVLYVIGGATPNNESANAIIEPSASIYKISVERKGAQWESLPSDAHLPQPVYWPLVTRCKDFIYAIGGKTSFRNPTKYVQIFDREQNKWKPGKNSRRPCCSLDSSCVIYEGKILVVTVEECLSYDHRADQWTSYMTYPALSDHHLTAVVYGHMIVAIGTIRDNNSVVKRVYQHDSTSNDCWTVVSDLSLASCVNINFFFKVS